MTYENFDQTRFRSLPGLRYGAVGGSLQRQQQENLFLLPPDHQPKLLRQPQEQQQFFQLPQEPERFQSLQRDVGKRQNFLRRGQQVRFRQHGREQKHRRQPEKHRFLRRQQKRRFLFQHGEGQDRQLLRHRRQKVTRTANAKPCRRHS